MPGKNTIKQYSEGSFYHIYNRGVEKRTIFQDDQDYCVLLSYLKTYLQPIQAGEPLPGDQGARLKNYFGRIELAAYCLMPNHFHMLIKQNEQRVMAEFMLSLFTRYSVYFNRRHDRTGKLFEGRYKAVLIDSEYYLLHLSRYIHRNPIASNISLEQAYSSYADYLGLRNTLWIKKNYVLSSFQAHAASNTHNYQTFVEDFQDEDQRGYLPKHLIME